jgi:hypothetical protein
VEEVDVVGVVVELLFVRTKAAPPITMIIITTTTIPIVAILESPELLLTDFITNPSTKSRLF